MNNEYESTVPMQLNNLYRYWSAFIRKYTKMICPMLSSIVGYSSKTDYSSKTVTDVAPSFGKGRGAVGLTNLGNTCFMNSTLQCLLNTPGLTEYFRDGFYKDEINLTNALGWQGQVAEEYASLIRDIWRSDYKTVAPVKLKRLIGEIQPRFSGYQQHDSSELLSFLMDGLHEDLNRVITKPYTQEVESDGIPDEIVAEKAWERHLKRNQSVIVDMCQGQFKSRIKCPDCSKESRNFDPYMLLSLPLPQMNDNNERYVSIDDCLDEFTKKEILGESEAWYCSGCRKHQRAEKKIDLWTLPDILIIHLKRFKYHMYSRRKINTFIDFPIEELDMSRWVVNEGGQKKCVFNLFAVSNHFGSVDGGHYTAYAKHLIDSKWYHFDDSSVYMLSDVNDVRTANAYILFYRRQVNYPLNAIEPQVAAKL